MNEIEIDGKIYITTKRAAELTRYTKDYVGQLARAQKIAARLVGRNWYVDEQDILMHAGLIARSNDSSLVQSDVQHIQTESPLLDTTQNDSEAQNEAARKFTDHSTFVSSHEVVNTFEAESESRNEGEETEASIPQYAEESTQSESVDTPHDDHQHTVSYAAESQDLFPRVSNDGYEGSPREQTLEEEVVSLKREMNLRNSTGEEGTATFRASPTGFAEEVITNEFQNSNFEEEPKIKRHQDEVIEEAYFQKIRLSKLLLPGAAAIFITTSLALALILYPNAVSKSNEYKREVSSDNQIDTDQSASASGTFLESSYEYRRK